MNALRLLLPLLLACTCYAPVVVNSFVSFPSAAWTPPTTTSLVLWLDAGLETAYSDGGTVQTPTDWSGSGNAPTQSTSAARPTWEQNEVNGNAVFRFDGVDDSWQGGASFKALSKNQSALSIYFVLKPATTSGTRGVTWWSTATAANSTRCLMSFNAGAAGKLRMAGRRLDADTLSNNDGSLVMVTTSFYCISGIFDWANSDVYGYINGTNDITNTSFQTAGSTSNTDGLDAAIGSNNAGTGILLSGDLALVLVYSGVAHDATTRQAIESSIRTRFGL